jgi:hypothetical protein
MAKIKPASVTMRVRVGENELEVTGPSDYVEKKIAEFLERQKSIPVARTAKGPTQPIAQTFPKSTKVMSTAQFFRKVAPKSDVDRVLAAGYFLEKFKNEENFAAAEAAKTIRDSKTPPPKNPNDAVNKNIKKGYMMAAGDKDGKMAFVLTTDGEEAIEVLLNA